MSKRGIGLATVAGSALLWALASQAAAQSPETSQAPTPQVPSIAAAQTDPAAAEESATDVAEIVVTGSRVARLGFDAPTPTTVLSAEQLQQRGTAQVGEFLNEIPAFRASQTPQTNPQSARGAGQYFADLRGLGSLRTLVLVDGRRFVPSSPEGQVDLSLIPAILVNRVDVVTGGASAQWGSDAVAGVVNVILNNDLDGLRTDFSYGIAEEGDNQEWRASAAYGGDYADGRGHFVVAGEYVDLEGVDTHFDRAFGRDRQELVSFAGARAADQPSRFYASGVGPLTFTTGGVILGAATNPGGPLRGIQFGPGGTVQPFVYGTAIGASAINSTGGQPGLSIRSGHTLVLPVERRVGLFHTDFDVSDNLRLFMEASYARAGSDFHTAYARDSTPTGIVIQRDNAFLPDSVRAIMVANNIANFGLGREHRDFGEVDAENFNTTGRIVVGASGAFGDGWTWDAYYQYGRNEFRSRLDRLKINANLVFAADAIRDASGAIVCRNAAARTAGCVPINLFGEGSASQAAIAYVTGTAEYDINTTQSVAAANIQGEPFDTWAGPVSLAAGVERRVEESESIVDAISQANGFSYGNPKNFEGEFDVNEGYVEAVVPLARDLPFAQSFDVQGAARYSDYSTAGGVFTWKLGFTWNVNDQLTFRATRSRDIRAPNNSELFAQTSAQATLRNPFSGATTQFSVVSGGNPDLGEERADTTTLGVVYSPSFVPNLRLSVDYFDIEIADAISSYAAQTVLDNCGSEAASSAGPGFFCDFVIRTGTGPTTSITRINTFLLNIAGFESRGVDFEAAYRFDLGQGRVAARLFGTYTIDLLSDDGLGLGRQFNAAGVIQNVGSVVDRAGQVGGFNSASLTGATSAPEWVVNATVTYSQDRWSVSLQQRYVDGGRVDATLVGPQDADYSPLSPISIGDNRISSRWYTNVGGTYDVNDRFEVYGVVNNLFDTQPAFPYTAVVGFHDRVGRSYRLGVRANF